MFVRWQQEPGARRLNQLAFCCGLSLTHHRLALFFAGPALLWAAVATQPVSSPTARNLPPWARARPRRRLLARAAGYAALPLLLYLWLPFRSAFKPPLNWGNTSASLDFFLTHITGRMYYGYAFASNTANVMAHLKLALGKLWGEWAQWPQWAHLGVVLGVVGVALMLLGLVGTVHGLITIFSRIGKSGLTDNAMLAEGIGTANTFYSYACCAFVGLVFTIWAVPETKGRTLEEIERSWLRSRRQRAYEKSQRNESDKLTSPE
jgi:hypothetical protein